MLGLEGVIDITEGDADDLKQYSLMFDRLNVFGYGKNPFIQETYEYLVDSGFIKWAPGEFWTWLSSSLDQTERLGGRRTLFDLELEDIEAAGKSPISIPKAYNCKNSDIMTRCVSRHLKKKSTDSDIVPIRTVEGISEYPYAVTKPEIVLSVAIQALPVPGQMSAWQDILNFKQEMNKKQWCFRRFVHSLATKEQTEAEIRDDIEFTLNEYAEAMRIHQIKAETSFLELYVIPVMELAENLAKFNWSKIAKGALSVRKRQVELMEAEMKAPGRECAYVFEAQKRFRERH